jgi:L-rhamnose mutarotase
MATLALMSYGTIMIGKLKAPGTGQTLVEAAKKWEERKVDGFQGSYSLLGDDGTTVVACVVFESKAKYAALADNPDQDEWWKSTMAPLLDGDPQWIDGVWAE